MQTSMFESCWSSCCCCFVVAPRPAAAAFAFLAVLAATSIAAFAVVSIAAAVAVYCLSGNVLLCLCFFVCEFAETENRRPESRVVLTIHLLVYVAKHQTLFTLLVIPTDLF